MSLNALSNANFPSSFYKVDGQGPPIVLVHGFAENHEVWSQQVDELKKSFRVIRPALPGCGTSAMNSSLSMAYFAEFISAILDQEKIEKTILIGHSMGGYAAMSFAQLYSNRLMGLSLVHSSARADTIEKKNIRDRAIEHIKKHGKASFFKTLIPKLYGKTNRGAHFDVHYNMTQGFTDESTIACYQAMKLRENAEDVLMAAKFPIQFVLGLEDESINYLDGIQQGLLADVVDVCLLPDVGHSSMFEAKDILNKCIFRFCNDTYKTFNH